MIASLIIASSLAKATQAEPVELLRKFKAGEKFGYQVRSHLLIETQQEGQPFFLPEEEELNYDSTLEVKKIKADGFAEAVYLRPKMILVQGDSADGERKEHPENVNFNLSLTLSPINEVTDVKDLNAPVKKPAKGGGGTFMRMFGPKIPGTQVDLSFIQELQRMSIFIGSIDTSLDLSPKLPFEEVKKGDTWKRTASYQPQKVKNEKGKMAVQRIDFTYVYDGLVEYNKEKVHQITGTLHLDTDAGAYINQMMGTTPGQSGLKSIPMKLDSKITYYLDSKTMHTVFVKAESLGNWQIILSSGDGSPVIEQKLKGDVTCKLASHK